MLLHQGIITCHNNSTNTGTIAMGLSSSNNISHLISLLVLANNNLRPFFFQIPDF
ncbi:hypothetical protein [Tenacibaculum sp.]|uniref:hypothetical protein n=1 Tax=Tenacibaculum sp. TaxID=1906242 RepID=UPI003AA7E349